MWMTAQSLSPTTAMPTHPFQKVNDVLGIPEATKRLEEDISNYVTYHTRECMGMNEPRWWRAVEKDVEWGREQLTLYAEACNSARDMMQERLRPRLVEWAHQVAALRKEGLGDVHALKDTRLWKEAMLLGRICIEHIAVGKGHDEARIFQLFHQRRARELDAPVRSVTMER